MGEARAKPGNQLVVYTVVYYIPEGYVKVVQATYM